MKRGKFVSGKKMYSNDLESELFRGIMRSIVFVHGQFRRAQYDGEEAGQKFRNGNGEPYACNAKQFRQGQQREQNKHEGSAEGNNC